MGIETIIAGIIGMVIGAVIMLLVLVGIRMKQREFASHHQPIAASTKVSQPVNFKQMVTDLMTQTIGAREKFIGMYAGQLPTSELNAVARAANNNIAIREVERSKAANRENRTGKSGGDDHSSPPGNSIDPEGKSGFRTNDGV